MKAAGQCPKCILHSRGKGRIVHVPKVDDSTYGGYAQQILTHKGFFLGGDRRGCLEAYVCNDCGYVEFYITDFPLPQTHADVVSPPRSH